MTYQPLRTGRRLCVGLLAGGVIFFCLAGARAEPSVEKPKWTPSIDRVLDLAKELEYPRGGRLPLYLWPAMNPGQLDDNAAEELLGALDRRGVGLVCRWNWGNRESSLAEALVVARAQKRLGLRVNVDTTSCLSSFFNGDQQTAHVDEQGKPFWDASFGKADMGCPFALDFRRQPIRQRIEHFADAYVGAGVPVDFAFADWEVDGPLEWNQGWEASKRCRRCRENVPQLDNFMQYQQVLRNLRSDLQRDTYAEPLLARFPMALVGNYALYPHNGFRYWYDYFEKPVVDRPALVDQKARYRHWANEFEGTGYTFAMPVVYTWSWTYQWYDYRVTDYRWFYNMLLVASNAGQHTPPATPIISFVHWHTTVPPDPPDPDLKAMSPWAYQELLWHMLLRGVDTFFLWCTEEEQTREIELLHPVWAAAQEYGEFLEGGIPISFAVPKHPGTVVSGLRLGQRILVRRTDFTPAPEPVEIRVDGKPVQIPPAAGKCQIVTLGAD
jgi:hypothetical protein